MLWEVGREGIHCWHDKSVEYIVHPLGRFIIATGGEMIMVFVFPGHLHSIGL